MNRAILDKIRKCFALAASANEHEAAAALAKARALMAEHGISEADVALADIAEAKARTSDAMRPPRWETILSMAVCRALAVSAYLDGEGKRSFVGVGASAEIAAYAFQALYRQLKAARRAYIGSRLKRCKPGRKRQRADAYCEGWAYAVHSEIAALAPTTPSPLIQQWLAERHPSLMKVDPRGAKIGNGKVADDWVNGHCAGDGVQLHKGVGGSTAQKRLAA